MADDNHGRYRSSNPFGRGSAAPEQTSDPLAELARLIGRHDPFADLEREARAVAQRDQAASDRHADLGPPRSEDTSPGRTSEPDARYISDSTPHHDSEPAPRLGEDSTPHFQDDRQPRLDWPRSLDSIRPHHPDPFHSDDPFSLLSQQSRPTASSYESQAPSDLRDPSAADDHFIRSASEEPAPHAMLERPAFLQALYPQEPEPGFTQPPHHDEFYDDVPRSGRRRGLLTVAAVLALAVLGTAGAFGYRSYFSGANSSAPPPVIRASNEPSKVAPPAQPQPVDQTASKFSYDRFGDRGQNERMVVREETPVDNRELGRSSMPRTVLPAGPSAPAAPAAQSTAHPPSALGEPRRVRTVPIRPDGPDAGAPPQTSAPRQAPPMQIAPASPPPPPAARQPMTVAEAPANSRAEVGLPPVDARSAPARSSPRLASRSVGPGDNAPLSLSPDGNHGPPPMAAREAPPPRPAAPARVAAAPAGNGGGYLVQVSSQRSQADAESAYRGLKSKFSNVLNGQRHVIKRADLGSKGVYYRAMVGPFGSREQAVQLCGNLKAAGGDCLVQAN
jgi:hypothetical protein